MVLPKNVIANYADDTTPYSTGTGIHNIISDLEQASDILSNWFQDNYLKAIRINTMCFSMKHLKLN